MKPFDLEKAKAGAPVCTRNGLDVRIICYDRKDETYPIIALIMYKDGVEEFESFTINGEYDIGEGTNQLDLMIKAVKRKGWINLYNNHCTVNSVIMGCSNIVFETKEKAINAVWDKHDYIDTVEVEWEE